LLANGKNEKLPIPNKKSPSGLPPDSEFGWTQEEIGESIGMKQHSYNEKFLSVNSKNEKLPVSDKKSISGLPPNSEFGWTQEEIGVTDQNIRDRYFSKKNGKNTDLPIFLEKNGKNEKLPISDKKSLRNPVENGTEKGKIGPISKPILPKNERQMMKSCAMRLGQIEKSILRAIIENGKVKPADYRKSEKYQYEAEIYRDELPAAIFGWEKTRGKWSLSRSGGWLPSYRNTPSREYRSGQATLTRALQSLFRKGLIDCGSWSAWGLKVYSQKRAAAMGVKPEKPLTDKQLDEVHTGMYGVLWTKRKRGDKPMRDRNIKGIRLTDVGIEKAESLNVKL
jgi:hypothetical protein